MTYAIQGVANILADTVDNLPMFDPTLFKLVDTEILADGKGRETTYQLIDEDPALPVTIRLGVYPKLVSGIQIYNVSLRVSTFVVRTLDTVEDSQPASVVIAWTMPWTPVPVSSELFELLGLAFSWINRDVVTGSLTQTFIDGLQYSLTDSPMSAVTRS